MNRTIQLEIQLLTNLRIGRDKYRRLYDNPARNTDIYHNNHKRKTQDLLRNIKTKKRKKEQKNAARIDKRIYR